jgi:hypothetical protein
MSPIKSANRPITSRRFSIHVISLTIIHHYYTITMNTKFLSLLLSCILAASCSNAFVVTKATSKTTSTSLQNGFLNGGGNKITARSDEDDAMWFEPAKAKKQSVAEMKAKKGGVGAKKGAVPGKKAAAGAKPTLMNPLARKAMEKRAPAKKAVEAKAAFKFPWQK